MKQVIVKNSTGEYFGGFVRAEVIWYTKDESDKAIEISLSDWLVLTKPAMLGTGISLTFIESKK